MLTFSPPNQLTFLRIILTPVFVAFLLSSNITLRQVSVLIFFIAMLTDWYDGWVARRWGYVTRWGSFLDQNFCVCRPVRLCSS
ncbi:MAG: CDP-alcohol phosphatidyltransferase family protein [Ignavibacteriales bacterium]|nr:CDP-alcohol phosphatidyltransferase family protein [Ignavibacteriales bacterium]